MPIDASDFQAATGVSHETLARLATYAALLRKWQGRMNLVGPRTIGDLWRRHFLDSAQLLLLIRENNPALIEGAWVDLGTGAGFPGLVLSLMGVGDMHLYEANARKCTFLRQVIRETGATARVHEGRIEDQAPIAAAVITSRALTSLPALLALAERFATRDTELWLLKGQDVEKELTSSTISWRMDVQTFTSQTDQSGRILRLTGVERINGRTNNE